MLPEFFITLKTTDPYDVEIVEISFDKKMKVSS